MIYNPIFEEEKEKKPQFKHLKKEIKHRAHKEGMKNTIDRLYNLLQKKPILTIATLFHPLINWFKFSKNNMSLKKSQFIGYEADSCQARILQIINFTSSFDRASL